MAARMYATRSVTRRAEKAAPGEAAGARAASGGQRGGATTGGGSAEGKPTGKVPVYGNTDAAIRKRDDLAQKATITSCLVSILMVLQIQKLTGLGPLFACMPVFIFLIAVEHAVQRLSGFHSAAARYTVAGFICSVSCGIIQQIAAVLVKKAFLNIGILPYEALFSRFGTQVGGVATQRCLGLVFGDLVYYCLHRFYHQVQVGWMWHAIHHNNDHYNFAVALRQSWGNQLSSWVFYLPLAAFICPDALTWASEWNLMYALFLSFPERAPFYTRPTETRNVRIDAAK